MNIMASELKFSDILKRMTNPAQLDAFLTPCNHVQEALLLAFYELKKRQNPNDAEIFDVLLRHWNKHNCRTNLDFAFELCALNNWVPQAEELINTCEISNDGFLWGVQHACNNAHSDFLLYMINKSDFIDQHVNIPALLTNLMKHSSNEKGHNALKSILTKYKVEENLNEVIWQTLLYSNRRSSKLLFPYIDAPLVMAEYKNKWFFSKGMEQWFEKSYAIYQKSLLKKALPKSKATPTHRKM